MPEEGKQKSPVSPSSWDVDTEPLTRVLGYHTSISLPLTIDCQLPPKSFRMGILAASLESVGEHAFALSNPASPCVLSAVATLDTREESSIQEWCWTKTLVPRDDEIIVTSGDEGFRAIIEGSDVDAVYLALPLE